MGFLGYVLAALSLVFIAGVFDAVMDTIRDHWSVSIFDNIRNRSFRIWMFSDPRRKYVKSDLYGEYKRYFGFTIPSYELTIFRLFAPPLRFHTPSISWKGTRLHPIFWDGWHCAKQLMILSWIGALYFMFKAGTYDSSFTWLLGIAAALAWFYGFNPLYGYFFLKKEYRRDSLLQRLNPLA